jgi:hypothetical protein
MALAVVFVAKAAIKIIAVSKFNFLFILTTASTIEVSDFCIVKLFNLSFFP